MGVGGVIIGMIAAGVLVTAYHRRAGNCTCGFPPLRCCGAHENFEMGHIVENDELQEEVNTGNSDDVEAEDVEAEVDEIDEARAIETRETLETGTVTQADQPSASPKNLARKEYFV